MQEGTAALAARRMLAELMEERRWRVPQVADALGISVDIVRRWIQGKSRMQIDDMVAVARLKGEDLNELFGLQPTVGGQVPSDVEGIIDRKLETVLGKVMMALGSSVGYVEEQGQGRQTVYREDLNNSARGALNRVSAARGVPRRRKSG